MGKILLATSRNPSGTLNKFSNERASAVALAALASVSAFAQSSVTISGKLRYAYESTSSNTGTTKTTANGLRVTDGDLNFVAVEDLGGGMKATASMAYVSRGRDTTISGRDASLSLSGGFGSVMIGSIEAGNGIIGLGGAGAPVYGMDGPVIAGASNVDIIKYALPSFNGFTLSVSATDATAGLGMESTATTQDSTGVGVSYAAGPLAAAVDFTSYGANSDAAPTADDRVRMSASYNLGMAKVGAGYQKSKLVTGVATKDMIVGLAVPMGSTTFGVNYATSQVDGGVKVKGYDLGVKYDLSKRTYVAVQYQSVDNKDTASTPAIADANKNSKFRVQLSHAF